MMYWSPNLPIPRNVTLFGNVFFADVTEFRWGLTGFGRHNPNDLCPYKEREIWRHIDTPEWRRLCDDKGRDRSDEATSQGKLRIASNQQKLEKFSSVQFSHSVVSISLRPHELHHARPPCPSPTPGVHSDSCPSSVMPSSHLILCRPLLLLPPNPPSIRVFSNKSTLCMRWPKYWSFSYPAQNFNSANIQEPWLKFQRQSC